MKKPPHKARVRQARHTGKPFACFTHAFLPTLLALVLTINSYGQIPVIGTPKPSTFNQVQIGNSIPTVNPTPNIGLTSGMTDVQIQNQNLIRQIEQSQKQNSYSQLNELYADLNHSSISYQLPELSSLKGTEYFETALSEINEMLTGKNLWTCREQFLLLRMLILKTN